MPNGVSCAYFAARNFKYGKIEKNPFKEGIANIQTVRTADAFVHANFAKNIFSSTVQNVFSIVTNTLKKLLYPLIIATGVLNTARAKDKVKTGATQAGAIGTMYAFEQVTETALKKLDKKILASSAVKNHKILQIGWYAAKGLTFVASSMLGYDIGFSGAESLVDKHRSKNSLKAEKFPIEADLKAENVEATLFEDMIL